MLGIQHFRLTSPHPGHGRDDTIAGMKKAAAVLAALFLSCAAVTLEPQPAAFSDQGRRLRAIGFHGTELVVARALPTGCEFLMMNTTTRATRGVGSGVCPDAIRPVSQTLSLASGVGGSRWLDGQSVTDAGRTVDARSTDNLIEPTGWRRSGRVVAVDGLIGARLSHDGSAVFGVERAAQQDRLVRLNDDGTRKILFSSREIESYDLDPKGFDIAVSARRGESFDVALVATDGTGEAKWLPADPADETMVRWAPRGNKVAYVISANSGTVIRSVHIPTGYQVTASIGAATVYDVAWEPQAERFAIITSTPTSEPSVEWLKYAGDGRETLLAGRRLTAEAEQVAGRRELLFAPRALRYGVKYPLVIVRGREPLYLWSEAVAALAEDGVAGVVRTVAAGVDLHALAATLSELPWVDRAKIYIVEEPGVTSMVVKGAKSVRVDSADRAALLELVRR